MHGAQKCGFEPVLSRAENAAAQQDQASLEWHHNHDGALIKAVTRHLSLTPHLERTHRPIRSPSASGAGSAVFRKAFRSLRPQQETSRHTTAAQQRSSFPMGRHKKAIIPTHKINLGSDHTRFKISIGF